MTYYTDKEILRKALTALESCSGAPHWEDLQPAVTAIKQALAAPTGQEPAGEVIAVPMGLSGDNVQIRTHFYQEIPPVGTKVWATPPAQPNRGCGRCEDMSKPCDITSGSCAADHLDALAAPPAPVQEPVAWGYIDEYGEVQKFKNPAAHKSTAYDNFQLLYTTPPAQPAPVQAIGPLEGLVGYTPPAAQPAVQKDRWVGTVVDSGYGYKVIGFAPGTLTDIPVGTRCYAAAAPEKGKP
jgi:hypothetical protein